MTYIYCVLKICLNPSPWSWSTLFSPPKIEVHFCSRRKSDRRHTLRSVTHTADQASSLKGVASFDNIFACPLSFLRLRECIIGSIAGRKIETRANINMFRASASAEQSYH
jgi:hypothetical protein